MLEMIEAPVTLEYTRLQTLSTFIEIPSTIFFQSIKDAVCRSGCYVLLWSPVFFSYHAYPLGYCYRISRLKTGELKRKLVLKCLICG